MSSEIRPTVNKLYKIIGSFIVITIVMPISLHFIIIPMIETRLNPENQSENLQFGDGASEIDFAIDLPLDSKYKSTPPEGLIHFWQEGSLSWSCGIWGSSNLLNFTAGIAEVDTDHPEFGEFVIWIDPSKVNTVPGHGYINNIRFWSLDQKGAGLSSQDIVVGQSAIIKLKPNTGRYGLGNPQ